MTVATDVALRVYRHDFWGIDQFLGDNLGDEGEDFLADALRLPNGRYVRHPDFRIGDDYLPELVEALRRDDAAIDQGLAAFELRARLGKLRLQRTKLRVERGDLEVDLVVAHGGDALSGLNLVAAVQRSIDSAWQTVGKGLKDKLRAFLWLIGASVIFASSFALSVALNVLPGFLAPVSILAGLGVALGIVVLQRRR